jgi:hypothetical protein
MDLQSEEVTLSLLARPILVGAIAGLVLALLFSSAGKGEYWNRVRRNILPCLGYAIPTSVVAYIAGYLTGVSRASAVGSVLPAVLALIGGLNIYFFGTENRNRALVGYSVFVFAVVFFYGIWGAVIHREGGRVGRFISLSEQEKAIRNYRENRGLSPDVPGWLLDTNSR